MHGMPLICKDVTTLKICLVYVHDADIIVVLHGRGNK
jgi:hypothetical protein